MMQRKLAKSVVVLSIFAVCIVGISQVQKRMDKIRDEHELVVAGMTPNMTPTMVFTVTALSAFRGLIADILFLKHTQLQEDGKYFELNQLGRYIIQLQPDAPGVYIFLAWNSAYNVSVKFSSPVDRWRWVQRGIELLRDFGLEYNPRDPKIIHELGWIYYHKVGDMLDDANAYYKGQLALQVIEILGPARRYDWDRLAAAPDDEDQLKRELGTRLLRELLGMEPGGTGKEIRERLIAAAREYEKNGRLQPEWEAQLKERGVWKDIVAVLKARGKEADNGAMMDALKIRLVFMGAHSDFYNLLHKKGITLKQLEVEFRKTTPKERPFGGLPKDIAQKAETLGIKQLLDDYFRTRWFRDKFKVDADALAKTFKKYGYHDMRLPEGHSLYWAEVARPFTPDDRALQRLIRNSMYRSTKYGEFLHLSPTGIAIVKPKFDSIEYAIKVFENTKKPTTGTISGFVNYLKDTVVICYAWGELDLAAKYYKYMKDSNLTNTRKYKKVPLTDFVMGAIAGDIQDHSRKQTLALLMGMARQYISCLAFGRPDKARRIHKVMDDTYKQYHARLKGNRHKGRLKLPKLMEIVNEMYRQLLLSAPSRDILERYRALAPKQPPKRDGVKAPTEDMKIQKN